MTWIRPRSFAARRTQPIPPTSTVSGCRPCGSSSDLTVVSWAYAHMRFSSCLAVSCVYPRRPQPSRAVVGPTLGIVDHQIRRHRQVVQDRPSLAVCWADIPQLSVPVRRCPAAWQQYWQQPQRSWHPSLLSATLAGYLPARPPPGWTRPLLPPTRLLPNPGMDGFCQGRLGVYMNHASSPGAVALRSQTVLTGSGSPRYSYGGLGGGHLHSTRIPAARSRISPIRTVSLGICAIRAFYIGLTCRTGCP